MPRDARKGRSPSSNSILKASLALQWSGKLAAITSDSAATSDLRTSHGTLCSGICQQRASSTIQFGAYQSLSGPKSALVSLSAACFSTVYACKARVNRREKNRHCKKHVVHPEDGGCSRACRSLYPTCRSGGSRLTGKRDCGMSEPLSHFYNPVLTCLSEVPHTQRRHINYVGDVVRADQSGTRLGCAKSTLPRATVPMGHSQEIPS